MVVKKAIIRYSTSFKLKVVEEIESGKLNIAGAKKLYDIKGGQTIQNWLKSYGKNHLLKKVVRIEMADEVGKIKTLEKDKQSLESALAQLHLKYSALEAIIKAAEEKYGIEIKKKPSTRRA